MKFKQPQYFKSNFWIIGKISGTLEEKEGGEDVQLRTQKIIEEARAKAQSILKNAEVFSDAQSKKVSEALDKLIQIYADKYGKELASVQSKAIRILESIPKDINDNVRAGIGNYKAAMEAELLKTQEEARLAVKNTYKAVYEELERYKKDRIDQLDKSILAMVEDVSKRVFKKEISVHEHEKLVMKALEEAKRQGMF